MSRGARQRGHRDCCLDVRPSVFADGQNAPNGRDQPVEFDRLGIEVVAAGGKRLFALAGQRMSGESDHWNVAGSTSNWRERVRRRWRPRTRLRSRSKCRKASRAVCVLTIAVPPIVSEETFALAQERLETNKTHAPRRTVTPSVVQGLVSCAKCGYALYRTSTRSSARAIHYYRCLGSDAWRRLSGSVCNNRPVRQDLLDGVVWTEIVRLLVAFSRFCSADLPDQGAFYNAATGLGYNGGQLYLNGEESGVEGRPMAHIASGPDAGNSYELAWLGNMAYENVVANPHTGDKTVVGMMDDGQNGQVYFYFGDKKATGNAIEQAGLTGGHLFGIKVEDFAGNNNNALNSTSPLSTDQMSKFSLVDLGDVSGITGAQIDQASETAGVASFLRPEDGAWDTINANRFYFVTTNAFDQPSQLWAVDFADASNPAAGGTIRLLLDGSEGQQMLDNITVNKDGKLILCEDVGNNAHIGKVWEYDPTADSLIPVAQHDTARFAPGGAFSLTQDEESSGVLDVSDILGSTPQNAYLIDVQAHFDLGGSLVQGGQLLVMHQDLL